MIVITIKVQWDPEARIWWARSTDIGVTCEGPNAFDCGMAAIERAVELCELIAEPRPWRFEISIDFDANDARAIESFGPGPARDPEESRRDLLAALAEREDAGR